MSEIRIPLPDLRSRVGRMLAPVAALQRRVLSLADYIPTAHRLRAVPRYIRIAAHLMVLRAQRRVRAWAEARRAVLRSHVVAPHVSVAWRGPDWGALLARGRALALRPIGVGSVAVRDVLVTAPLIVGVGVSYHFAGLAHLITSNAIFTIEMKRGWLSNITFINVGVFALAGAMMGYCFQKFPPPLMKVLTIVVFGAWMAFWALVVMPNKLPFGND